MAGVGQRRVGASVFKFWAGPLLAADGYIRAIPIRWRILLLAALNILVALVLAALIWNGARILNSAWNEVRQVRQSDQLLGLLQSESGRLQSLIHRYINQPGPDIFAEILLLREAVLGTLGLRGKDDPMLSSSVNELSAATERLFDGFADLRAEQTAISQTYDAEVVAPANYNGPGQIVIAGHSRAVARAGELAVARGGKAIPLKVSAPFHCALMRPVAERLRQVDGTVQWMRTIERMAEDGVTHALEIGPGKVLAGLVKRITKQIKVLSVSDMAGIERVSAFLSEA